MCQPPYDFREGLLPPPVRVANGRRYNSKAIGRIRIIQVARSAGFSVAETRAFVGNYPGTNRPGLRWQAMADDKRLELDALIARATEMKRVLSSSFNCVCSTIEVCEQTMIADQR